MTKREEQGLQRRLAYRDKEIAEAITKSLMLRKEQDLERLRKEQGNERV